MYFCQRVEDNAFHLPANVTSNFDEIRRPRISPSALSFMSSKNASRLDKRLIFQYQVKSPHTSDFAALILCLSFVGSMPAQPSSAERVAEIQAALRDARLDGWLFYDFRHSDPLAYRILKRSEERRVGK